MQPLWPTTNGKETEAKELKHHQPRGNQTFVFRQRLAGVLESHEVYTHVIWCRAGQLVNNVFIVSENQKTCFTSCQFKDIFYILLRV